MSELDRVERDGEREPGAPRRPTESEDEAEGDRRDDLRPAAPPAAPDGVRSDVERDPGEDPDDRKNPLDDEPEIRAVLLDLGGVILDLGEARGLPWGALDHQGRQALVERVREAGGVADEADLDRWLFEPWRRGYARRNRRGFEERWGPHLARLQRRSGCRATRGSLLGAWAGPYLGGIRPVSGAQEALERLASAGLLLGLTSNVPLPGSLYTRVLEREGVAPLFGTLRFSYDRRARKPGPNLLFGALEALDVDPEEAVMVGDRRSTDVAAGRAAGLRTIQVTGSGGDGDGPAPDATVGSLVDLPARLGL